MSKKLSAQIAKKVQGPTLEKESVPKNPHPQEQAQYRARTGWGGMDSFAYAVKNVMEQAKHTKGSESSFLGKDKQIIDPKSVVNSEMLHKKSKK